MTSICALRPYHADVIVAYLNNLLSMDPVAMGDLFLRTFVPVNEAIADHPTVVIRRVECGDVQYMLGPLGLINGMLPKGHVIVASVEECRITRFSRGTVDDSGHVTVTNEIWNLKIERIRRWCVGTIVGYLNELLSLDPTAVSELFLRTSVNVNQAIVNHPTTQVRLVDVGDRRYMLGPLGLMNGLLPVGYVVVMNVQGSYITSFAPGTVADDGHVTAVKE